MSSYRQQAHLDAPLATVWALIGSPRRHPEWWPRVIEVEGERFEVGDEYAQVTEAPRGRVRSNFLVERRQDLREVRMSCDLTGTYVHWSLTEAQGGTFVDLEMGMEPRRISDRLYDAMLGRRYFSRWIDESLAALELAARAGPSGGGEDAGLGRGAGGEAGDRRRDADQVPDSPGL